MKCKGKVLFEESFSDKNIFHVENCYIVFKEKYLF